MQIIEPCCTQKNWPELRKKIGNDGTTFFHAYGDLSIAELLPVMLTRYTDVRMTIVCPSLPNAAAEVLLTWMNKKWARQSGGDVNVISSLTLITDLRARKSPDASKWVQENPFPGRLMLHNIQQNDTAILLPDIALFGNINMAHNGHFVALATSNQKVISNLSEVYKSLTIK